MAIEPIKAPVKTVIPQKEYEFLRLRRLEVQAPANQPVQAKWELEWFRPIEGGVEVPKIEEQPFIEVFIKDLFADAATDAELAQAMQVVLTYCTKRGIIQYLTEKGLPIPKELQP